MTYLSDSALNRLRAAADTPDLSSTRYRPIDKLGQGGMGGVYRVEDTVLQREVALKIIAAFDSGTELGERLLHEARVIAQLEHPGIVPVHDVGRLPDGCVFYAMKLVQGDRLDDHISGLESLAERLRIFGKICEAVSFAHSRGVLHRDLKPQNIMVGPFGEVLVMDWGISKVLGNTEAKASGPLALLGTNHGTVLGTPGFMAPEQARGEHVDHRADVFSLGALLQFMNVGSSRVIGAISSKAMAEKPGDRYASVHDLSTDVAHFLDGLPVSAYPESWTTRLQRWAGKNKAWLLLILAYLIMRTLFILWRAAE
ncbi:MAG TPA: serine/threonine-protein kinase [Terriglobales bacterium]